MKKINKTLLLASTFLVSSAITVADKSYADGGYDLNVEPSTSTNFDNLEDQKVNELDSSTLAETDENASYFEVENYNSTSLETDIPQDLSTEETDLSTIQTNIPQDLYQDEASLEDDTYELSNLEENTEVATPVAENQNIEEIIYYNDKNLDEIFNPSTEDLATKTENLAADISDEASSTEETREKEEISHKNTEYFAPKGSGVFVQEKGNTRYYENNKLVKNANIIVKDKFYNIDKNGNATNPKATFDNIGHDIYYVDETGTIAKGIKDVMGAKYYFNKDGILQMNKRVVTGESFYNIGDDGKMIAPKSQWNTLNGKKYFNDKNGSLLKGINTVDGKTYYFDNNGVLTGNKKLIANDKYYTVNKNGEASNPKNAWFNISGKTYRSDDSGKLLKGAKTVDGKQYVFDSNGAMAQNTTILSAGKFYQTDEKGIATNPKNTWVTHNGQKYHTNESGYVKEGVWRIDDQYYYFTENGLTPNQVVTQKGVLYTVDALGIATKQENNIPGEKSLDKVMEWMFNARDIGMTYNMGAGRTSATQADCSSAVYRSLIYGGFLPEGSWVGNTESLFQMGARGTVMYEVREDELEHGDIFVAGVPGASLGADGHTGFILNPYEDTIIHMNYGANGVSVTPRKGNMGDKRGLPVKYYRLVGANSSGLYTFKK